MTVKGGAQLVHGHAEEIRDCPAFRIGPGELREDSDRFGGEPFAV
jgi:hypothetical protein